MVFSSPSWVPKISQEDIPDSISVYDFLFDERHGRAPFKSSGKPFVWASGDGYDAIEVGNRIDYLARSLTQELGWHPNRGSEWDKVIGIFTLNSV